MDGDMMGWELYEDKVIESKGWVEATDPCYSKSIWNRMYTPLAEGTYRCWYNVIDGGRWGERVRACAILRKDLDMSNDIEIGREVGTIGVDSGMAGFFIDKPDYTDKQWKELCNDLNERNWPLAAHNDAGFFTSSGFGDGIYPVYELIYNRQRMGIIIIFIGEEEE